MLKCALFEASAAL